MKSRIVKVQDVRKMIKEVIQEMFHFNFEDFDLEKAVGEAPQEVKDLFYAHGDDHDYASLEELRMNLNALGYDIDYDLGGEVTYFGPKNSMLEEGKHRKEKKEEEGFNESRHEFLEVFKTLLIPIGKEHTYNSVVAFVDDMRHILNGSITERILESYPEIKKDAVSLGLSLFFKIEVPETPSIDISSRSRTKPRRPYETHLHVDVLNVTKKGIYISKSMKDYFSYSPGDPPKNHPNLSGRETNFIPWEGFAKKTIDYWFYYKVNGFTIRDTKEMINLNLYKHNIPPLFGINEIVYLGPKNSMLEEGKFFDDGKNIPEGIKSWVKRNFGTSVSKYTIRQGETEVQINMPWHDADRETYQFFKLENGNASPVGNEITRSGMESDSPQGYIEGQKNNGKVTVPEGFVLVCYGTYPKRVDIYTGQNVQGFLPDKEKVEDLGPTELLILYVAKNLKPFARPKFKDEFYDILIKKGLMKSNRSITLDGRNLLEDPDIQEKIKQAKELFKKKTGRYI